MLLSSENPKRIEEQTHFAFPLLGDATSVHAVEMPFRRGRIHGNPLHFAAGALLALMLHLALVLVPFAGSTRMPEPGRIIQCTLVPMGGGDGSRTPGGGGDAAATAEKGDAGISRLASMAMRRHPVHHSDVARDTAEVPVPEPEPVVPPRALEKAVGLSKPPGKAVVAKRPKVQEAPKTPVAARQPLETSRGSTPDETRQAGACNEGTASSDSSGMGTVALAPGPGSGSAGGTGSGTPGTGDHGGKGRGTGPLDMEFGSGNGPGFLRKTVPQYPALAREKGREGSVLLRLTIDEQGRLVALSVVEGSDELFKDAALRAVRQSTFVPAKLDGTPVSCRVMLPIRFALKSDDND